MQSFIYSFILLLLDLYLTEYRVQFYFSAIVEDMAEGPSSAWDREDRDYTYDELLQRVFIIIKDKNPDSVEGGAKKFVMRPPQVVKVGAKKTAFVNFAEIAKM